MNRVKPFFPVICALVSFAASRTAAAQAANPDDPALSPQPVTTVTTVSTSESNAAPTVREEPRSTEERERPVRVGAMAGIGFPRPVAVEGFVKLNDVVLGAEYGALPTVTISDVDVSLWSLAADARWFPLGGVAFLGLRAGRQHIAADTSIAPISSQRAGIAVDSWYLNPRVGLLWMSKFGLTLGTEAGVQIPFGADVTNTVPPEVATSDQVNTATNALGRQVIPTLDILRVGLTL